MKILTKNALEYLAFDDDLIKDRRYAPRNPNQNHNKNLIRKSVNYSFSHLNSKLTK